MMSVGVLVSGNGSNLQALLDASAAGTLDARVAVVISNVAGVPALERARLAHVPSRVIPHGDFGRREDFDAAVVAVLREHGVDLVVLAGFMRVVTPVLLQGYASRVINVHPSLLPAFPGLDAQAQALAYGVCVSGCTVHLVDAGMDTGPILAQVPVPVYPTDTTDSLRARILAQEHIILPTVVSWFAADRVTVNGRRVRVSP